MSFAVTRKYSVSMEVAGPAAMWTRVDTGSASVSEVVPSWSATKGMFESIARLKTAYIRPVRVEICAPIQTARYTTNYAGPLRNPAHVRSNVLFQLRAVVLQNVCYRLHGEVEACAPQPGPTNHRHALQEMFERRLRKGQCFRPVCLGLSEFVASYWGPIRAESQVQSDLNIDIASMLHSMFDRPVAGKLAPRFVQNRSVRSGVLDYVA